MAEQKSRKEAERKERERLAAEKAEKDRQEKLAANKRHRAKIEQDAENSIAELGLTRSDAQTIVNAASKGALSHIILLY